MKLHGASKSKSFPTKKIVPAKDGYHTISCTHKGAFGGSKFHTAQAVLRKAER